VFYFRLPAYPHTSSSLTCFGCCSLPHKRFNFFAFLTFSPSCLHEASYLFIGSFQTVLRPRLTSANTTHSLPFNSECCFSFGILSYLGQIIGRSPGVRQPAFYGCSLCIYVSMFCAVIGLLFVVQHHPHRPALYAVSVRKLPYLPLASFRFQFTLDTLALS
jgi:hypothetical protein